jgi:hypothetical protein
LGGWCWNKVAAQLGERGNEVYAPTLTGLAERAHLASPDVGLTTYVQDVAIVVVFNDLRDVILVSTSSGAPSLQASPVAFATESRRLCTSMRSCRQMARAPSI